MFKTKLTISISIFITLLVITSIIKNKTRVIEKQISYFNSKILLNKKDVNESQLDFYYLSSPKEIEKRISTIGFSNYQPISYSKIFFDISHFTNIKNKVSNLKKLNEKKNKER